jgi:hypothetical protein
LCSGSVGGDHWPGSLCILMPPKELPREGGTFVGEREVSRLPVE